VQRLALRWLPLPWQRWARSHTVGARERARRVPLLAGAMSAVAWMPMKMMSTTMTTMTMMLTTKTVVPQLIDRRQSAPWQSQSQR
jgi:hypothetical protein